MRYLAPLFRALRGGLWPQTRSGGAAADSIGRYALAPGVTVAAIAAGLYCQSISAQPETAPATPAATPVQDRSYGLGFVVGEEIRTGLEHDGVGAAKDLIAQGFRDGLNAADPLVARDRMDGLLRMLHHEMQDRMVRRLLEESPEFRQLHDANLSKSMKFHELFGRQEGVVTLPSGVQYKVLRAGSGRSPARTDTVVVTGQVTLLDGTVISEGSNIETRVDGGIEGGAEALTLMRPGAKWQIAVPPQLAYGVGGSMPKIGPMETVVGIVELVAIK